MVEICFERHSDKILLKETYSPFPLKNLILETAKLMKLVCPSQFYLHIYTYPYSTRSVVFTYFLVLL